MAKGRRSTAKRTKRRAVKWLDQEQGKKIARICTFDFRDAPSVVGACVKAQSAKKKRGSARRKSQAGKSQAGKSKPRKRRSSQTGSRKNPSIASFIG